MKISTKGRYALRVMIDLAEHREEGYIPMKTVAQRQDISLKYLERILPQLVSNKLVFGVHGKGGGYKLNAEPDEITVLEILTATEGDIAVVSCLECDAQDCERKGECKTFPIWQELNNRIQDYLQTVTLDMILGGQSCAMIFADGI